MLKKEKRKLTERGKVGLTYYIYILVSLTTSIILSTWLLYQGLYNLSIYKEIENDWIANNTFLTGIISIIISLLIIIALVSFIVVLTKIQKGNIIYVFEREEIEKENKGE